MDWKQPRLELTLGTGDINYLGKTSSGTSDWTKLRTQALNKHANTCRYCGGTYTKYLLCFHVDSDPYNNKSANLEIACRLCYIVSHINFGHIDDVIVCHSSMTQMEIVRQTVNYIISNNKPPRPQDIDKKATKIPMSIMELNAIMLSNNNSMPDELSNYKIFFTDTVDMAFTGYYDSAKGKPYMFTESSDDEEEPVPVEKTLPLHTITQTEKDCINKFLDTNLTVIKTMKKQLNNTMELSKKTKPADHSKIANMKLSQTNTNDRSTKGSI